MIIFDLNFKKKTNQIYIIFSDIVSNFVMPNIKIGMDCHTVHNKQHLII